MVVPQVTAVFVVEGREFLVLDNVNFKNGEGNISSVKGFHTTKINSPWEILALLELL